MLIEEPRRCSWCTGDDLYQRYHDEEWGVPIFDSVALFERLALESMQAGLAWITVLKKRERMRMQFYGFNPLELAKCDESHIQTWLLDPGLIRHKGKLNALVRNAQLTVAEEDFSGLLWRFAPKASQRNLYFTVSISTKSTDEFYYGVHGDWETRRYFTSFSILDKKTYQKNYTENEFQVGIAPYLGEYNQLHTWIMLKSKEDTRDDKWKTYPFIKLFKGDFLLEVGSKESHWDLHFMKRF